jgi:hypothetical protein
VWHQVKIKYSDEILRKVVQSNRFDQYNLGLINKPFEQSGFFYDDLISLVSWNQTFRKISSEYFIFT